MKLNKHEQAKPNFAGLTSQVQRGEMKLILADMWPPLKPLPVFKYGTGAYRAEIHFDRARGEWVCRKTSLPSNKVQELRGGLTEMTLALPHDQEDMSTESVADEPQDQDLESRRNRRLQTIREWTANFENGALYSELQDYLSENQQDEIYDSIRMTLTARQLQFNAKNVEFVFDALWKAGGRLVTLLEIAQRNKVEQKADASERPVPEIEHLPKLLRGDKQPSEISSRKSRMIFSNPSVRDEEVAARYEGIFPSESTFAKHTTSVDEIKSQQGPLPTPPGSRTGAGDSGVDSVAEISIGDFPQSLEASFPSERPRHFVAESIKTSISDLSVSLTPETIEGLIPTTLENFRTEPFGNVSPDQIHVSSPKLIAPTTPQASEFVAREILDARAPFLDEALPEKVHQHAPATGSGEQVRIDKRGSSADRIEDPPSRSRVLEISGFQAAAFVFLFAVIGFTVGTLGLGLLGRRPEDTQKSILAVNATSSALSNRPGKSTSPGSTPPRAAIFDAAGVNPPAPETQAVRSENPSAQPPLKERPADSAAGARPTGPSSAVTNRSHADSDDSSGANKLDAPPPSEEKFKKSTRDSESFAKALSKGSNSSPPIESKPSTITEVSPKRDGSSALFARIAPPSASPKLAHSPKAGGPIASAPRHPAPRKVTPAIGGALHQVQPSVVLVTPPAKGSKPFRVTFPQKPIAASSSFAIASQLSVLISPEQGPVAAHQPARLQAGELVSYVWPRYSRSGDRYRPAETIKVRATIGQLGQVLDIKPLSGSTALLPAATNAIRRWRYKPTLLNQRPVQAQQDVTIEFRPPQSLSHGTILGISHK